MDDAIRKGDLQLVKRLMENENVNSDIVNSTGFPWMPIGAASYWGHLQIVKFFWEQGADIHVRDDEAFRWASENGHLSVVKFLWEKGADIHAENDEAIWSASWEKDHEIVKFLWEKGADISRVTPHHEKYLLFCDKINKKRQVEAANKIGRWWIPICYDTKRECGKRMMERGWEKYQGCLKLT